MTTQPIFRAATIAALALFATTVGSAQGLGGSLNKAKEKVNQATSVGPADQNSQEEPTAPPYMTVAAQEKYTRALLAPAITRLRPEPVAAPNATGEHILSHTAG